MSCACCRSPAADVGASRKCGLRAIYSSLGYARVSAEIQTPIQFGENLQSTYDMVTAPTARAGDYVMPDVQRIGGVTGWLRAAAIAQAYGIEMSSHLFSEYSAHLLAVTPTCHYLEYMDWATPIIADPIEIREGRAVISRSPRSRHRVGPECPSSATGSSSHLNERNIDSTDVWSS